MLIINIGIIKLQYVKMGGKKDEKLNEAKDRSAMTDLLMILHKA